ncbi:MAG: TetR/AcrR family transcriptional regulator, partial [Chloroflexota bacterium]|nr:TetR/AcrR family transcriptional regulator [Chloroflexota bacterium]
LALVEQQLTVWFAEVDAQLADLGATCTSQQVTEVLCQALEGHPGLTRLLAILHTILEQNIDFDAALHFKYLLLEHFEYTGALLEQCLPFLAPGQGAHLLLQCHALVIGLWHLSDPAPVVQQVLCNADLCMFKVQFAAEFSSVLQALLYGLERIAQATHIASPQEEIS